VLHKLLVITSMHVHVSTVLVVGIKQRRPILLDHAVNDKKQSSSSLTTADITSDGMLTRV